ncbi:uncharacterized protein TNCV_429681 [Trichonephila clavipes]|nr:uncharacterized protein TNCV_429681 [Trichonephila clavipes]
MSRYEGRGYSDEDIRLSETDYEESEEKTDIIDYIPVNPVTYIARDSTEWIPNNSNVPGRFAIRNVLRQSSGPTSFVKLTATDGSDVVQSGRPIFDDFFQHLWPYIGNNTANVVFQMVKRFWLIRIDQ